MSVPAPAPKHGGRGHPLGRGLAALIPEELARAVPAPSDELRRVPIDAIGSNPEQPRSSYPPEGIERLAESIRTHGILSPLVVRPLGAGRYELLAGERRLRAAALAGLSEVPVLLRGDADDPGSKLELALVENLQRQDLDPVEAARGYRRLVEDFGLTQEQVAARVGRDRSTVANALRILHLPDGVLRLLQQGRITMGHAKALLPLDDPVLLREVLAQVLSRQLSVRATESLVRARTRANRQAPATRRHDPLLDRLSDSLGRSLGTRVQVRPRGGGGGGRIVIDYYSTEDLERLVMRLRGES